MTLFQNWAYLCERVFASADQRIGLVVLERRVAMASPEFPTKGRDSLARALIVGKPAYTTVLKQVRDTLNRGKAGAKVTIPQLTRLGKTAYGPSQSPTDALRRIWKPYSLAKMTPNQQSALEAFCYIASFAYRYEKMIRIAKSDLENAATYENNLFRIHPPGLPSSTYRLFLKRFQDTIARARKVLSRRQSKDRSTATAIPGEDEPPEGMIEVPILPPAIYTRVLAKLGKNWDVSRGRFVYHSGPNLSFGFIYDPVEDTWEVDPERAFLRRLSARRKRIGPDPTKLAGRLNNQWWGITYKLPTRFIPAG